MKHAMVCFLMGVLLCLMCACSGVKRQPDTETIPRTEPLLHDSVGQEHNTQPPVSEPDTVTIFARSVFIELTPDMQIHSREEAELELVLNIGEAQSDMPKDEDTVSVYCNGQLLWSYPFYQNAAEKGGVYIIRDMDIFYPEESGMKKNPVTFLIWSYIETEQGMIWKYSSFGLDAAGNKRNEKHAQHMFTKVDIENNPQSVQILLESVFLSPINQDILNGYVLFDNTGAELVYSTSEQPIACKEVQYRFAER